MTQKPDDDLFENIVNRGYRVYGHGIDEVVRDVVALGGRPLVETLLSHGWKPWRDEYQTAFSCTRSTTRR